MALQKIFKFLFWLVLSAGYAPQRSFAVSSKCERAFKTGKASSSEFVSQNDILYLAGKAEELTIEADGRAARIYGLRDGDRLAIISSSLSDLMERILQHERMGRDKFEELKADLKNLETELRGASQNSPPAFLKQKNSKALWSDLLEDPSLLKPNIFYPVIFQNGLSANFIFNKKVADQFFNSNNKVYNEKLAKRILFAAGRGFVGQRTNLSGLRALYRTGSGKRINRHSDLLEIRGKGDTLGHIRIGGFKSHNQIHFVHYAISSDHAKIRERFIAHVLNRYVEWRDSPKGL